MKHIRTLNEWFGQKLLTGHDSSEKELSKKRIEDEIESAIQQYNENPEIFAEYDLDILREELLQSAKENGYRGSVEVVQTTNDPRAAHSNKYFIIYKSKNTSLQNIGSAAGGQLRK